MSSFSILQLEILRWAEARKIIPNSTPQAQLLKTVEELGELVGAVVRGNRAGAIDGFGDVLVTLILAADLMDIDITKALESAYDEIKDRKGTMTPAGVFVKEAA
jgi:NTP pyrophosphatase (non-canonical NTP hydrolase)